MAKGGQRGFDTEAPFMFPALCGGFFRSGEGEEADWEEGTRSRVRLETLGFY